MTTLRETWKTLGETWLITERQLLLLRRSPSWMITALIQPILYLVLFAPLLKTALGAGSTGQAYQIFVPGLLVMLALYSTLFAGFTLIAEQRAGVLERHRVTPVSRQALLLGRCLREVITLLLQASVIVLLGLPFGLSVSIGDLLLVYLLLGLLALLMSMLSYAAALRLRSEDALGPVLNTVTQPLLLLSGVLLPITAATAPAWLLDISRVNPLTWTVRAVRELFAGHDADLSIWVAVGATVVLAAVVQIVTGRAFVRSVR